MGILSNKISKNELKPGDHIYAWRTSYVYAHHGIYVGEGKVIQFTVAEKSGSGISSSPASSAPGNSCPQCGYHSGLHGVISSCIDCFLDGDSLCLFEYDVSIPYFIAKVRGGTCTLASSDPPEVVLHRARYLLQKGFGAYSLFKNNCEDFAIYCKTGLIVIADTGMNRGGRAATFLVLAGVVYSATGLGGVAIGYCANRLRSDISMRSDAKKIPVEELVSRYLSR